MPDSRYKSSMTTIQKNTIATFIAAIVHLSGAIGMLYSSHADWFIGMTPYNLLLMAVLVLWTQEEASQPFYLFMFLCILVGIGTEMIGVNTSLLFGSYRYGTALGIGWLGVPFLIGVNWFLVVWSSAQVMLQLHRQLPGLADWGPEKAEKWLGAEGGKRSLGKRPRPALARPLNFSPLNFPVVGFSLRLVCSKTGDVNG